MLVVKSVIVGTERYTDAYEATVSFQVGPQSYSTVAVKLTPEATREVVELAVAKAAAMLTVMPSEIRIAGEPIVIPLVDEPAPEFAEVDDAPPPAPAADVQGVAWMSLEEAALDAAASTC
jgi:hypothetical protein